MRLLVPFLALLPLWAGCSSPPPATPSATSGATFVTDAAGDAPGRFDVVGAHFLELSGSLVLRVEIQDATEGPPYFVARLSSSAGAFEVRLVHDASRPTPPQLKAETGRIGADGQALALYDACWVARPPKNPAAGDPWLYFVELLHNRTGLTAGGSVSSLALTTRDHAGVAQDSASGTGSFAVSGGANPYAGRDPACPLSNEQNRLS